MDVHLQPVAVSEKDMLWSQMQAYIPEFIPYEDIEAVDGVYAYKWFEHYWADEDRWPFWAMADEDRVGFALLCRDGNGAMEMAEFYIRPQFRRRDIGLRFARLLLLKFPGSWIISEYQANSGAVAFWRRVLEPYHYTEESYFGDSGKPRLRQRASVPMQG